MAQVTDRHEFTIWRYDDGTISLNCHRDEYDVDLRTALMEASVLSRCLAEEIHGEDEVFSMRVFDKGCVSTYWRRDEDFPQNWATYRWLRRSVTQGLYGGLVRGPRPPEWVENLIARIEYGLILLIRVLKKPSGREEAPAEVSAEEQVVTREDNVIPFRRA